MIGRRIWLLVAAGAVSLAAGCGRNQVADETPPEVPQTIDELKNSIAKVLATYQVPGAGVALVARDKVLWVGGVGKADLQSRKDVDADTMFRIGSITKGFVALAILQLQAQGRISLDSKVSELVPEVPIDNRWEKTDPVTVANLLEHTAGFDEFPLEGYYDFSPTPTPLLKALQAYPGSLRVRWRPGTLAAYSSNGYGVAGYLVEKVSGESCDDYVANQILRPLGMANSSLAPGVKGALAQGYVKRPPRPVPYRPIILRSGGEMKSSPADMARFVRMMLNRGELDGVRIVSADDISRMETPRTGMAARAGLRNGYGLGNAADLWHPFLGHGHYGLLDGFRSVYMYMPEPGLGYFLSINASGSEAAFAGIHDLISTYLTRGLKPSARPAGVPLDSAIANRVGFYELASPRNEHLRPVLTLRMSGWTYIEGGKLYRRGLMPKSSQELIYLGHNQVRTDNNIAADGVYGTDAEGDFWCNDLACFRRVDPTWPVARFALIVSALMVMSTTILFAIMWIPRKLLGRMKGVRHLSVRAWPLLATVVLIGTIWPASTALAVDLTHLDALTAWIFVGTIAFAIFSLISVIVALHSWRLEMNRAVRMHSTLAALSCAGVTWFLAYWGAIGVRVWKM
jgi:CubicO group peptidase (beta-lactamase class C family)